MVARRLLATDLDGTFLGDADAMHRLWQQVDDVGITVAFSTGRHLPSIEAFYTESGTDHRAAACVCMVGTEIWHASNDGYVIDEGWSETISESWDKYGVETVLRGISGAVLQPEEWQSRFKSSYFLEDDAEAQLAKIREGLQERGIEAKVVYSAGRFLDLLPSRSGKGGAVSYLADLLGIAPGSVITAGDTGNDLDMMRPDLGFRSIAVGNASPELRVYRAPNVYHATASFAAGIQEGLHHYGWLAEQANRSPSEISTREGPSRDQN
ncbi:MAG: HAD-IIB family hydrolase [Actinomycetota bacterium]|nr:HAD-IIB family hydrolase [Actinomycetota bacterium]